MKQKPLLDELPKPAVPAAPPPQVTHGALIALLYELLAATRVKAVSGYVRGRCIACNRPHVKGFPCHCPGHRAIALLAAMEVENTSSENLIQRERTD